MKDFRELKAREDFRFKKALGQNLLIDPNIIRRIASVCADKDMHVLEIGPGTGAITEKLCETFNKVTVCELDAVMVEILKDKCRDFKNLDIIHNDILKLNLADIGFQTIVANLPYSISTKVISLITDKIALQELMNVKSMYILVQEEVGDRICFKGGVKNRSPLGIKVNAIAETKKLFTVSASCFRPRPKISSAFICIEFSPETPDFSPFEYKLTMEIINYLFTMRRKKIFKVFSRFISEKGLIKGDSDNAAREILINAGIDSNLRPERIEWINFLEMARKYIEFAELAG